MKKYSASRNHRPCTLCAPRFDAIATAMLLRGHSYLCLGWHLKRLGVTANLESLYNHMESQKPYSIRADYNDTRVENWTYVPPVPPAVSDEQQPELLLIRGVPYAGKTRYALTYGTTHTHIEADYFFLRFDRAFFWNKDDLEAAHLACKGWARRALQARRNVVVANTFILPGYLEPYFQMATELHASVRLVEMPRPDPRGDRRRIPTWRLDEYNETWLPLPGTVSQRGISIDTPDMTRTCPEQLPIFCQPWLCRHADPEPWEAL